MRQTMLLLPTQLLMAAGQLASLVVWAHFSTARAVGIVALLISIQEFMILGLIGFWTTYAARFGERLERGETDERRGFTATQTWVVLLSIATQALAGAAIHRLLIDPAATVTTVILVGGTFATRAMTGFQAERSRAWQDNVTYFISFAVTPNLAIALSVPLLLFWRSDEQAILLALMIAQSLTGAVSLARDHRWIAWRGASATIVRHAARYGLPVMASSALAWVAQNMGRIATGDALGLATVGAYSIGSGLGLRVTSVAAMLIAAAAYPIAVRTAHAGHIDRAVEQISDNTVLLLAVLAPAAVGMIAIAGDLSTALFPAEMVPTITPVLIAMVVGGSLVAFRLHVLQPVLLLRERTGVLPLFALAEALVAAALAYPLVHRCGALGGGLSLIVAATLSLALALRAALALGWHVRASDLARIALATAAMAAVARMGRGDGMRSVLLAVAGGGLTYGVLALLLYRAPIARLRRGSVQVAGTGLEKMS